MLKETKDKLLGQSFGSASNRLRKTILYSMLCGKVYDPDCFRCGQQIDSIEDLSIEHKVPWQSAPDPQASFFDLENIAFSHLSCNSGARQDGDTANRQKTECLRGHPFDEENTYRRPDGRRNCRQCHQ